ncbi:hypothetical protein SAMN05192544_103339 [Paraburkholderia hospita]|nr:hypothetical protein SAMN05192544_103339 [Paraburkholderia hospita]
MPIIFGCSINPSTDFTVNNWQTDRLSQNQGSPYVIRSTKFVTSALPQMRES